MSRQHLRRIVDLVDESRQNDIDNKTLDEITAMITDGTWDKFFLQLIKAKTAEETADFFRDQRYLVQACLAHHHDKHQPAHCPVVEFQERLCTRTANSSVRWFFTGYYLARMSELQCLEHTPENAARMIEAEGFADKVLELAQHFIKEDPYLAPFFYRSAQKCIVAMERMMTERDPNHEMDKYEALQTLALWSLGVNGSDNFDLGCRVWAAKSDEEKLARL